MSGKDACDKKYELGAVDETMEEINGYTTQLFVGEEVSSWKLHSPNVELAVVTVIYIYILVY